MYDSSVEVSVTQQPIRYRKGAMPEVQESLLVQRILERMRVKNASAADVAKRGGLSESALSNILSGKRPDPRSASLEKIARGLGTTSAYLTGETNDPLPSNAPPLTLHAARVLEAMQKLPNAQQRELAAIADALLRANNEVGAEELYSDLLDDIARLADTAGSGPAMRRLFDSLSTKTGRDAIGSVSNSRKCFSGGTKGDNSHAFEHPAQDEE